MATVQRSNIGQLHDQLSVTLAKEDYYPQFEKSLKQYGKNASIPGFRKGQVPSGMIKKMYGQSVYTDEVLKKAYAEIDRYVKEHTPEIFAQPLPLEMDVNQKVDMNHPGEYTFNFEIGLKPEFSIKAIDQKTPLTKYTIEITDDMLDKEIENIRKRAGQPEEKDIQNDDLDIVSLTFTSQDEEAKVIEDVAEYGRLPQVLKDKLKGTAKGSELDFSVAEISSEEEKEAFLKESLKLKEEDVQTHYKVAVTKVASLKPREMDEEFYKDVFPNQEIKDEAGFREELKKALAAQLERYTNEKLQNDIFETLVHTTELHLPEAFLRKWLKTSGEHIKSDEEVEKEWPSFDHQLKWTLISEQLIKKYGINVSYDEVMLDIRNRVSSYFGMPQGEEAPWMQSYLDKMSKDEQTLNETHRRLLMDKLFLAVEKDLNISTQEVSDEEFSKLPSAHQH